LVISKKRGIREYREIIFKPYRIIYRIMDKSVYVLFIDVGRREMQSLLQRRLLNAYQSAKLVNQPNNGVKSGQAE
jgi:hypothetical protein